MKIVQCLVRAVGLMAGLAVISWALPPPFTAIDQARTALVSSDIAQADGLAAGLSALALWALLSWLVMCSIVTAAAALPGQLGRLANHAVRKLAPRVVRRMLAAALGVTVATGLLAPLSAQAAPPERPSYTLNLDWPTDQQNAEEYQQAVPNTSAGQAGDDSDHNGLKRVVAVAPGDSLWRIAEQRLGPQATKAEIAQEWPRWWQANRDVIGENPHLIKPGQQLQSPE